MDARRLPRTEPRVRHPLADKLHAHRASKGKGRGCRRRGIAAFQDFISIRISIAIAVRQLRIRGGLAAVVDAVPVAVALERVGAGGGFHGVADPVVVRVRIRRVGPREKLGVGVQPVAVMVGRGIGAIRIVEAVGFLEPARHAVAIGVGQRIGIRLKLEEVETDVSACAAAGPLDLEDVVVRQQSGPGGIDGDAEFPVPLDGGVFSDRLAVEAEGDVMRRVSRDAAAHPCAAAGEVHRQAEPALRGAQCGGERKVQAHPLVAPGHRAFEVRHRFVRSQRADRWRVVSGEVVVIVPQRRGSRCGIRPPAFLRERREIAIVLAELPDGRKVLRACRCGNEQAGGGPQRWRAAAVDWWQATHPEHATNAGTRSGFPAKNRGAPATDLPLASTPRAALDPWPMPAGSLLALLDDIASLLDDVSILTKRAAAKTAGVLGDDLALNAQQVSGVVAKRELPVVWAVAKGSFVNKLILVPLALVISSFAPWAVLPLLMIGGLYLCYEGCEKLVHHFLHRGSPPAAEAREELAQAAAIPAESEPDKIKGAIRTDFVLSAEIIVISLGTVADADLMRRIGVLSAIAVIMTAGVYGLVAAIVKLDDLGLFLSRRDSRFARKSGLGILWFAPFLMKSLSVLGTAAMFLVGGGIIAHGIPWVHHAISHAGEALAAAGGPAAVLSHVVPLLLNGLCGIVAGSVALAVAHGAARLFRRGKTGTGH